MNGRRDFRPEELRGRSIASPFDVVEGVLATNLDAASGVIGKDANQALTGSTTATLNLIEWSDDDTFYLTGTTATVVNRSEVFSAGEGTHLVAFKIGGEFRPMPIFQTVRGRLMRPMVSDDVIGWPKFCLMEVLGPGRVLGLMSALDSSDDFVITATTATTFVVTGDVSVSATSGRYLIVTDAGAVDGTYTISSSSYSAPSTTITVVEAVGTSTLTGSSSARVAGALVVNSQADTTATDFVEVDDTLAIWGQAGTFTALVVDYSAPNLTVTVDEEVVGVDLSDELAATVITATTSIMLTLTGDVRPEAITGHFVVVESAGSANGTYTIFGVNPELVSGKTQVTVAEAVGASTLTGSSTATILRSVLTTTIRPDSRLTYAISSVGAGDPGSITIADPSSSLGGDDPICACDMFLEGQSVIVEGTSGGDNDGVFKCRKAFTDNGSTITVYLDGVVVSSTGGTMTLKVPPPLCVKSKAMAVNRWYRVSLSEGAIVHTLPPDGDRWCEIIAADVGPSDPAEPDAP